MKTQSRDKQKMKGKTVRRLVENSVKRKKH